MLYLKKIIPEYEIMLKQLNAFIIVTEQAGFAKAAKKLGISNATITRYIQELESEYDTPLFTRTTRHISLTEQGESFYRYALEAIQLNHEVRHTLKQTEESIQGHIKMGMPASILQIFSQHQLPELIQEHPRLSIEAIQGNHINDLLSNHFDLVIHCGPLPDVNFYYEKIGTWNMILCAAPCYLKQHKTPSKAEDLKHHECLDHADNNTLCWPFIIDGKSKNIPINSRIKINHALTLKTLAQQGCGVTYLPSFTVFDAIKDGSLQPILKTIWKHPMNIYALYPQRKRHNKKISLIIEALTNMLK